MLNSKADTVMKNALIASLISGIGLLILACSGSELIPPNPPPPGPGPGPGTGQILNLTDEQRIAVLNECGAFADALGDLKSDAAQQALVTYLKSRGEFEDAGVMVDNVWANFHDGRLVTFIPDWLTKYTETGGRVPTPDISPGRSGKETGQRNGVPSGKKVMLFHGLGNAFVDDRAYLSDIFSRSHTEYRAESKDATVENLKTAKDVDIFYFDTHGGGGHVRVINNPFGVFSLWTSDEVSAERELRYRRDLDSTVLTYMHALEDRGVLNRPINEWHYAITGKFISEHMTFTENSLLYIDACSGYAPEASTFKETMMGRAKNGATTYIAWTGPTDDGTGIPTSRFIFDRLLGAPVYMLEAPPQRPFDLDWVFGALLKYNLGLSSYGGSLKFESIGNLEIFVTPSIKYITMDDYNSTMTIEGLFGDNSRNDGKVTVGGMTVPFTWSPYKITCELPVTGPGSSGDVIVIVNGHESNKVPLSEWTIPLHLVRDDFGIKIDARLYLKIRADVHPYREKPEEVPKTDRPNLPMPLPASLGFPFSLASTGTYTVGGQRLAYCVKDKCTMRDTESAVSQSGPIPFTLVNQGLGYGAYYKWSTDMKKIEVNVIVNIPDSGMEMELYTSCEGSSPKTTTSSISTTLGIFTTKPLVFHLDANFNITPDNIPDTKTMPWGRCETTGYFKQNASWPTVEPNIRPKHDTDARYASGN